MEIVLKIEHHQERVLLKQLHIHYVILALGLPATSFFVIFLLNRFIKSLDTQESQISKTPKGHN